LAMRARRSSTEIGFASAVMDLSSALETLGDKAPALAAMTGTPAALRRKTRLDTMVILFSPGGLDTHATESNNTGTSPRRPLQNQCRRQ
jgi:hypothetical protein